MPKSSGLTGLRHEIDRLDDQIIDLLGQRFALLRDVAAYKRPRGIPVVLPDRIAEVVERCVERGQRHGLDPQMLRDVYHRLIEEACRTEERALAEAPRLPVPAIGGYD